MRNEPTIKFKRKHVCHNFLKAFFIGKQNFKTKQLSYDRKEFFICFCSRAPWAILYKAIFCILVSTVHNANAKKKKIDSNIIGQQTNQYAYTNIFPSCNFISNRSFNFLKINKSSIRKERTLKCWKNFFVEPFFEMSCICCPERDDCVKMSKY